MRIGPIRGGRALAFCLVGLFPLSATAQVCSETRADLRWQGGQDSFRVEIADTMAERAQGLMHRDSLAQDAGMLFVYDSPRAVSFWMENTLIPLDMIFLDDRGVVRRVHENARPLDRTPIAGGEGIRFVLEINGGLSGRLGLVPGAQMRHPAIGADAAWPCD